MTRKHYYMIVSILTSIIFTICYLAEEYSCYFDGLKYVFYYCSILFVCNMMRAWNEKLKDGIFDLYIPILLFLLYGISFCFYSIKQEFVIYALYLITLLFIYSYGNNKNKYLLGIGFTILVFLINNLYRYIGFINIFSYPGILWMDVKYGVGRYVFVFVVFVLSTFILDWVETVLLSMMKKD